MIGFAAIKTSQVIYFGSPGLVMELKIRSSSFNKCFPLYVNNVLPQLEVLQSIKLHAQNWIIKVDRCTIVKFSKMRCKYPRTTSKRKGAEIARKEVTRNLSRLNFIRPLAGARGEAVIEGIAERPTLARSGLGAECGWAGFVHHAAVVGVFQNCVRKQARRGALVQLVERFQGQIDGNRLVGNHRGRLLQLNLLTEAVSCFGVQSPLLH